MAASPFNGPDPLELERPVVFRDIRAIRHEVQGLNTKLQVLNSRLQALEVARPCPGLPVRLLMLTQRTYGA